MIATKTAINEIVYDKEGDLTTSVYIDVNIEQIA